MINTKKIICSICFAFSLSLNSYAAMEDTDLNMPSSNQDWQLVKEDKRHNIRTYYKREDQKNYRSFKAEVIYDHDFEVVTCHQLDANNFSRWFMNTSESRLLKRISEREFYMYLRFKAPLAVPDRDVVLHVVVDNKKEKNPEAFISYNAVPDYIPLVPRVVRIPVWDVVTTIKQLDQHTTQEVTMGYAESGDNKIPAWLINFFQRQMPYANSLGRVRDIKRYQTEKMTCSLN